MTCGTPSTTDSGSTPRIARPTGTSPRPGPVRRASAPGSDGQHDAVVRVGQQPAEPGSAAVSSGAWPREHPLGVRLGPVLADEREDGGQVVGARRARHHAGPRTGFLARDPPLDGVRSVHPRAAGCARGGAPDARRRGTAECRERVSRRDGSREVRRDEARRAVGPWRHQRRGRPSSAGDFFAQVGRPDPVVGEQFLAGAARARSRRSPARSRGWRAPAPGRRSARRAAP